MLTIDLGHLGIQQASVCHLLPLCFVLLNPPTIYKHADMKLLGCDWVELDYMVYEEALKDSLDEN
jgi:hypothetical protein